MRNPITAFIVLLAPALVLASAPAAADEWRDDEPSFEFLFGNHIDTHLRARLVRDEILKGALLIIFTGEIDSVSGLPIARHPRGAMHNEACGFDIDIDCVVGWKVRGRRGEAKFVSHSGVNGNDHPIWVVNRVDIPQPGAFSHFHWSSSEGTDDQVYLREIPEVCDVDMAGQLEGRVVSGEIELDDESRDDGDGEDDGDDEEGDSNDEDEIAVDVHVGDGAEDAFCPGWFLELRAVRSFAFRHGGEIVAVHPGIDNATHLNLITNYAIVPGITPTRGMH